MVHRNLSFLAGTLFALVLLCCAVPGRADEAYPIVLQRPSKVGLKYSIAMTGKTTQDAMIEVAGQQAQSPAQVTSIKLDGVYEVLAVSEGQRASKLRCTVNECVVTTEGQQGKQREELAKGTVVIAEAGKAATDITLENGQIKPVVAGALRMAFAMKPQGKGPTDDQVFGTKDKKKVGDSWDVDVSAAADQLKETGTAVDPADISGKVKLVEVKPVDGVPGMKVTCELKIAKFVPQLSAAEAAQGLKAVDGSVDTTLTGVLPLDATQERLAEAEDATIKVTITGNSPQGKVTVHTTIKREHEATYRPVK